MAKIITMPSTPNFIRSNFVLRRAVGSVASPYTGKVRTQEYDGVFWEATVTLPPMRRNVAKNWQSFLLELNGPVNHFKFADPDALNQQGTYNGTTLLFHQRINNTNIELDFASSNNTITAPSDTTPFSAANVGDFFVVSGATNPENNGTHKIVTITNDYTVVVDPVDYDSLVTEADVTGCSIKANVKGAKGINIRSQLNNGTGTILKGDYLGIGTSDTETSSNYVPTQYVMVTSDAVETDEGGSAKNEYSVRIEPKLRTNYANSVRLFNNPAKGLFRLTTKDVDWDADNISNYGISFSCIEVV